MLHLTWADPNSSQVFIECLGDSSVFVQSRNSNKEYGFHPCTVVKIQSGIKLKIFSNKYFYDILRKQVSHLPEQDEMSSPKLSILLKS